MEYNDELLFTNDVEEMARAYNYSLKENGFTFIKIVDEPSVVSENCQEILGSLFSEIENVKRKTVSKNAYRFFSLLEESIRDLFSDLDIEKAISNTSSYCEAIKKIIYFICELIDANINNNDITKKLLDFIKDVCEYIGECRYRKVR